MSQETKKRRTKTQPCPKCGGLMRFEKHDDVLAYKGESTTIKTLGWWCTKCGEAIFSGDPLVAHEKSFLEFKAKIDAITGTRIIERCDRDRP